MSGDTLRHFWELQVWRIRPGAPTRREVLDSVRCVCSSQGTRASEEAGDRSWGWVRGCLSDGSTPCKATKKAICWPFVKPSDGLEPSTPPYHRGLESSGGARRLTSRSLPRQASVDRRRIGVTIIGRLEARLSCRPLASVGSEDARYRRMAPIQRLCRLWKSCVRARVASPLGAVPAGGRDR